MLSLPEAIETRRSIRKFTPDEVSEEVIEQMIEAARLAPSAGNRQPWSFLVVRDPEQRQELRRICLEQKFMEEAPVVIVCFGNLERYSKEAAKLRRREFIKTGVTETLSGSFADPEFVAEMEAMPLPSREELMTPLIANTYIAIEHLVLTATALGLGTCWVGGFDAEAINRFFGLADTLVPVAVIPVGYPAGKIPLQRPRLTTEEILIKPQR